MKKYTARCEKCGKREDIEEGDIDDFYKQMKEKGWALRIGGRRGMVVGIWTCPDCGNKPKITT
jgi:hypothetical protein